MNLFAVMAIIVANAFITLFFYAQLYFLYLVIFTIMMYCAYLEFKELEFKFVEDERKII